jgi:hypothetical protein
MGVLSAYGEKEPENSNLLVLPHMSQPSGQNQTDGTRQGGCGRPKPCLPELREPDRVAAAGLVLNRVSHDGKAVLVEQGAVLGTVQARVVQRLALESALRLAVSRAAREHEDGARGRMRRNTGNMAGVEEAVPG